MKKKFSNLVLINHPIIKKDITLLRNKNTQTSYFRAAVKRISSILAVEISREFKVAEIDVETPLEKTEGYKLSQEIILIPVLRAGLSMVAGFLDIIPDCKVGHIGLERDEKTLKPVEYYFKTPRLKKNSKIILLDPMLATGGSASEALKYLKLKGGKEIVFACLVSAPEGLKKIHKDHPKVKVYSAALDRELNSKGYILPGLGDAGDRTFGTL